MAFRHSNLASGGINMAAQHHVGNTAAGLVLVLVAETLCRVNVNVVIDTPNTGRDSITGHIEGDTYVPGPAAHETGGSPSGMDIPQEIPRSSPRW